MLTPSESSYPENPHGDEHSKTKICLKSSCEYKGTPQPIENFFKRKLAHGYGLDSECKTCRRVDRKKWQDDHKEYRQDRNREWIRNNKEYINALRREKREKNKDHVNEVMREWKKKNTEKAKEYYATFHEQHPDYNKDKLAKWKEDHPEVEWIGKSKASIRYDEHFGWAAKAVGRCKNRAKRNGIPFDMNKDDLLDPTTGKLPVFCSIFTHFQLDYAAGTDQRRWASVDRIKPELGYVRGNVRVISMSANMAKLDGIGDVFPVKPTPKPKPPNPDQPSLFDGI